MTGSDFLAVLQWWGVLCCLGFLFLPLTAKVFATFPDKGYPFAKIFGVILSSFVIFFAGIIHLAPFTYLTSVLGVLLIPVVSLFWLWKTQDSLLNRKRLLPLLKTYGFMFFLEEVLFFGCLFFWSFVRAHNPDIHGLEKYMDFGFINSILRTTYFPPRDMWFTPFPINYYYFGHMATAVLTRLSLLPSNVTFNLMMATMFGLCFSQCFSLGATLLTWVKQTRIVRLQSITAGFLTAALVALAGNLHILYAFFAPYPNDNPVPLWQLAFQPASFPNSYWYPNATRFIHNTIHEFPIYSWVVADLHGHVLDIPIVLLFVGICLALFLKLAPTFSLLSRPVAQAKKKKLPQHVAASPLPFASYFAPVTLPYGILFGFLLAVMYMTNAWDGLLYLLFTGFFFLLIFYLSAQGTYTNHLHRLFESIPKAVLATGVVTIFFVLFALPFSIHFKPFASGIGVLCAPQFLIQKGKVGPFLFEADHCQHSPWWMLLTLYGFFYFFVISLLVYLKKAKSLLLTDAFILLLMGFATLLIIIPEFVYLKDIYPAHYRANTMFKLVFQSFILLSIASAYTLARIVTTIKLAALPTTKTVAYSLYLFLAACLIGLVLTYPHLAVNSYYGDLKTYQGLDGTKYLQTLYPTDYAAIEWINSHITGQPVILEAQGDSYTDYGRVSTNTGLPTVLGWTVHEWLWRGTYDIPAPRIAEVQTMYESPDLSTTKNLLKKYQVQYVFLGDMERQKYPNLNLTKWQKLGKLIYHNGETEIYKVN